jgi:hypothetical protein
MSQFSETSPCETLNAMILGIKEQSTGGNSVGQIQKFEEGMKLGSLKQNHACSIEFEDVLWSHERLPS